MSAGHENCNDSIKLSPGENPINSGCSKGIIFRADIDNRSLEFKVNRFDGSTGTLDLSTLTSIPKPRTLIEGRFYLLKRHDPLWNGVIEITDVIDKEANFCLCVSLRDQTDPTSIIRWPELPPCLSVLDSGYECLSRSKIEALLNDLITFHNIVRCRVHLSTSGGHQWVDAEFGKQDELLELTEIGITLHGEPNPIQPESIAVLEIEIFELTFFIFVVVSDQDKSLLICRLSEHWYAQRRREGRRVQIKSVPTDYGDIVEVSDFGIQLKGPKTGSLTNDTDIVIRLPEANKDLRFRCISSGNNTAGLQCESFDPESRKIWQQFIIQAQYPLLRHRTISDHEAAWRLLDESGYLNTEYGQACRLAKDRIFEAWTFIDECGPHEGTSVLAEADGRMVSTIGIARVNHGTWVAQAAAMVDSPKYLPHTRSVYGWRTRAILQQPDGEFHLAFFDAKKRFLDRFFRKFFLSQPDEVIQEHLITWDEWESAYIIHNNNDATLTKQIQITHNEQPDWIRSFPFLQRITDQTDSRIRIGRYNEALILNGRPHLHQAQHLASLWLTQSGEIDLDAIAQFYGEHGHSIFQVFYKRSVAPSFHETAQRNKTLLDAYETVVWTCHRSLLTDFLANSLRALELMHRKYGVGTHAA